MKRFLLFLFIGSISIISCSRFTSVPRDTHVPGIPSGEPILIIEPQGHSAAIGDIMFTPDGTMLISVSEDKTIRLWDVETGDLLRTIRGEIGESDSGNVYGGALSPGGKILAVTGFFMQPLLNVLPTVRRIRVFDLETGDQIGLSPKRYTWYLSHAVAFSADGNVLAIGCEEHAVKLWHVSETGGLRLIGTLKHGGSVRSVAFSSDGKKLVAASSGGTLRLWELPDDLDSLQSVSGLTYTEMNRHNAPVRCVAYAPDGKHIVSGGSDGKILLWDGDGTFLKEIDQYPGFVATVSFSSDSQKIVAAGGGNFEAIVYAIPSGEKSAIFTKHTNSVLASAFLGSDWIATAGGDSNEIYIWNAESGTVKTTTMGQGQRIASIALQKTQSNGLAVAFGHAWGKEHDDRRPLERSFDFSEMVLDYNPPSEGEFRRALISNRGKTLKLLTPYKLHITGGGTIENAPEFGGRILSYTFTNAGEVIVGSNQFLKRYRADGTFLHWFSGHTGPAVRAVSVSDDDRILASASDDQTIKLWDIHSGEQLATLFVTRDDEWICWTPQGYYAASAGGEKYIGWHLNQGEDRAAKFYPVSDFRERFHRPQLVKRTIELGSFEAALTESRMKETAITQMLPPDVEWVSPGKLVTRTSQASIRVRAKLYSDSEITEIRPLVNGRPVFAGRGLYLDTQTRATEKEVDFVVPLEAGKNRIALYAANQHASDTSEERIVVFSTSGADLLKKNAYAVSIGISAYAQRRLQLSYADDDAKAMSRLFLTQKGQLYENVSIRELYDEHATREAIVQSLHWLKSKATTPQDVALVFIAAHGYNSEGEFFVLPTDGDPNRVEETGVSWQVFSEILGNLPAQVVLFVDTCHSGQLGADLYTLAKIVDNTEAIRRLSSDNYGVVILAASTGREFSVEHADWGHGAFTTALLEGLEEGKADYSGDGLVHLRELDLYVAERVESITNGFQHPTTQKPSTISRLAIAKVK